jgi:hypothetical protein
MPTVRRKNAKVKARTLRKIVGGSRKVLTPMIPVSALKSKKKYSVPVINRGNPELFSSVATREVRQRVQRATNIQSMTRNGANGISVSGAMYLGDVVSNVDTTSVYGVRFCNEIYLHPNMLVGRTSIIASTFTRYRFRKIIVKYCGVLGSSTAGECIVTYTHDPDMDPTQLSSTQMKYWLDSVPGTYRGPVSTVGIQEGVASFNLEEMARAGSRQDKWYMVDMDTTTLNDVYQGKIMVALTNTAPGTIGDLELLYELELVEDQVSVAQVLNNVNSTSGSLSIGPVVPTGTDAPVPAIPILASGTVTPLINGVYSLQSKQDAPSGYTGTNIINKLFQAGSEIIGAVTGSNSGRTVTLFNSMADLISGAASRFISGGPTSSIASLAAKFIPLLLGNNPSVTPVTPSVQIFRTKGWRLALLNHSAAFPHDEVPPNIWGLTKERCAMIRDSVNHVEVDSDDEDEETWNRIICDPQIEQIKKLGIKPSGREINVDYEYVNSIPGRSMPENYKLSTQQSLRK